MKTSCNIWFTGHFNCLKKAATGQEGLQMVKETCLSMALHWSGSMRTVRWKEKKKKGPAVTQQGRNKLRDVWLARGDDNSRRRWHKNLVFIAPKHPFLAGFRLSFRRGWWGYGWQHYFVSTGAWPSASQKMLWKPEEKSAETAKKELHY